MKIVLAKALLHWIHSTVLIKFIEENEWKYVTKEIIDGCFCDCLGRCFFLIVSFFLLWIRWLRTHWTVNLISEIQTINSELSQFFKIFLWNIFYSYFNGLWGSLFNDLIVGVCSLVLSLVESKDLYIWTLVAMKLQVQSFIVPPIASNFFMITNSVKL